MKRPVVITLLIVALLFVAAGIGAVAFFTANRGFQTNNPFDVRNVPAQVEESKTLKVDAEKPLILKVADESGDVVITGADVDTVQVKVIKTAYDSSQARADEEVKDIKYTIEQVGGIITLKYELPKSMNFNNKVTTVDFIVTIPTETVVDVENNFGSVAVQDIQGAVDLSNDFGDVTAKNIEGELTVQSNGGEIDIQAVDAGSKNVKIDSDFGDITLEQIKAKDVSVLSNSGVVTFTNVRASGDVFVKSNFGSISYENGSAASLTLETDSGKTSITKVNIRSELKIDNGFGEIELTQAMANSYNINSKSGGIAIDGAKNNIKAHTDFGSITIENAQNAALDLTSNSGGIEFSGSLGEGPHIVKSDFGEITLTLPGDTKLNVDLKTDFGSINSDLPITVTLNGSTSSDKNQIVGSINGGGGLLTVQTNSGGIDITFIK